MASFRQGRRVRDWLPVGATLAMLCALAATGCGHDLTGLDLSGTWGGSDIELRNAGGDARLEYDCASGTIDEPLRTDRDGRFEAAGVHVLGHGGPVMEGEVPDAHPARYTGRTDGHEMTLTVTLTDTGRTIGTFSLVRGRPGTILQCL